ncbi:hypothetical protein AB205_0120590 [Aquarana catesbeiana]|uniref:Uncharacterized protein n=1 Tax=Aquarana catesbeiana TaxID=8400 RepID=A0A2G9QEW2_AQUCT|nr:hypothetical protein AB205_0120590 [Aquarana catesbeiana]
MANTMAERILNFTLEIIYLLTGESFPPVKSGDHLIIKVPQSLKPKGDSDRKILELTNKITDLLTGEGGLEGDVMDDQKSLSSWDRTQHVPIGIKEEPDSSQGEPGVAPHNALPAQRLGSHQEPRTPCTNDRDPDLPNLGHFD